MLPFKAQWKSLVSQLLSLSTLKPTRESLDALSVSSIKLLIPVMLDLQAGNYAQWRGLFEVALQKYALDDQIATASSSQPDAQWLRLDALVQSWLYAAISPDLLKMVMDSNIPMRNIWS